MASIEIIDLGINNVKSLLSAFRAVSPAHARVISHPNQTESPRLLALPGTGSFGWASQQLIDTGFSALIKEHVLKDDRYLVGICLGMQLFGQSSEEDPITPGLGLIDGRVERLPEFPGVEGRVPHVGWRRLETSESEAFAGDTGIGDSEVYFSHSFHLKLEDGSAERVFASRAGSKFLAAVKSRNMVGYQFHPEKSSLAGLEILRSLTQWAQVEN